MLLAAPELNMANTGRLRVLIVGLLDRQFALVANEFPALELHHQSSQVNASGAETVMMRAADQIVCMTKFISHTKFWKLDRAKTIMVNGGMAALRAALKHITTHVAIALPVFASPPTEGVALRADDFSILRFSVPGQTLAFNRRDKEPAHLFIQSAHHALDTARREHGVHATLEVTSNRALFTVTRTEAEPVAVVNRPQVPQHLRPAASALFRQVFLASQNAAPYASVVFHVEAARTAVCGWLSHNN